MKIYFDGCSWTFGSELKDPFESRYSKIICDHYGAEEHNFSMPGSSNDRIIRNLLVNNNIENYDLGIIQLSFQPRTEYYNTSKKRWDKITTYVDYSGHWLKKHSIENHVLNDTLFLKTNPDHLNFWVYYYANIANDVFFKTKEKIVFETIISYFKSKNIPLIFLTVDGLTKFKYDLNLEKKFYPRAKGQHPSEEGHKMIASDIINIIDGRQLL